MKVDFSQELKTIEGEPLLRSRRDRKTDTNVEVTATLQWVVVEALLTVQANETLTGEEKARRYALALKVQEAKAPLELPVEDVALAKKLVDAHFMPLIVGQARLMLDAKSD